MNTRVRLSNSSILKDYRLNTLVRFNHRTRIKDETVAAHSFFVSLFCIQIMDQVVGLTLQEKLDCMLFATIHDVPEKVLSDIPWDVKQIEGLTEAINDTEMQLFYQQFGVTRIDRIMKNEKVQTIVNLADAYSVKQFCLNEQMLGNQSQEIDEIFENVKIRIDKLQLKLKQLFDQ